MFSGKPITQPQHFVNCLQILFLGLKLSGNVDWSWWIVFSPVCVPMAIFAVLFASIGLITALEAKWK